jgi:hypothetical protein
LQKFAAQLPPGDAGLSDNERQVRSQQITSGPGALLTQGVNEKYAEQNKGKFEFPDDGQYQGGQIIQTADGLVLVTFDRKTGEPKLKPLGQGVTEKQSVQQLKNEGRGAASDNNPTLKRATGYAKLAALQAEDIPFSEFDKLQKTDPDKYFEYMDMGSAKAQEFLDNQNAAAGLRVPYLQAKTAEALANEKRGGVTGGQAATIQRQDTQDQLRAKEDVTKFEAELGKFQTEMNGIWNGWKNSPYAKKKVNGQLVAVPDGELENHMKLFDPDGYARYNKLKAEVTSAKTSLQGAQERAKVVGKTTPRGGGSGGRSLTGNLDIDRIMRNAPPSTGAPGGEHYVVQDPTAAQLRVPAGFNLDTESTPETTTGLRSVGRSFNNPNVFIMNPARFGLRPTGLVKGARLDTEKGVFEVMDVSADKTKVLVHKIPE